VAHSPDAHSWREEIGRALTDHLLDRRSFVVRLDSHTGHASIPLLVAVGLPSRQRCSGLSTQTVPERMDRRYCLSNAPVTRCATHKVAGTGRPASPQVAHRFEPFQEVLPRLGPL
jgi:hypothetical protein